MPFLGEVSAKVAQVRREGQGTGMKNGLPFKVELLMMVFYRGKKVVLMTEKPPKISRTRKKSSEPQPLHLEVTLVWRYGDQPEDQKEILNAQSYELFNDIFHYRDQIISFAVNKVFKTMLKTIL